MTTPEPDINPEAYRLVEESIKRSTDEPLPADLEAAWQQWSRAVKRVDERTMGLLKAAFTAGVDVGVRNAAQQTGREGGKKGGAARAVKLTPEQRRAIAQKAAVSRWKRD